MFFPDSQFVSSEEKRNTDNYHPLKKIWKENAPCQHF